jgi:hypothetical protein
LFSKSIDTKRDPLAEMKAAILDVINHALKNGVPSRLIRQEITQQISVALRNSSSNSGGATHCRRCMTRSRSNRSIATPKLLGEKKSVWRTSYAVSKPNTRGPSMNVAVQRRVGAEKYYEKIEEAGAAAA